MASGGSVVQQVNIKANLDISQAKGQISSLESAFRKLSLPKGMENNFTKVFSKMKSDVSQIETLMNKGLTSKADVNSFNKLTNSVDKSYSKILTMINQLNSKEISVKVDTEKVQQLESELKKVQQEYQNTLKKSFASSGKDTFGGMLNSISQVSTSSKTLKTNLESIKGALNAGDFTAAKEAVNSLVSGFSKLGASTKGKLVDTLGLKELKLDIGDTKKSLTELFNTWSSLDSKTKGQAMDLFNKGALEALQPLMNSLESETTEATAKMNSLNQAIASEKTSSIARAEVELKKYAQTAEQAAQTQQKANQQAQQGVMYQYDKQMQVNDLRMQVQYFFGLQNMINLFKRGVRDAIATVKELDQAMTATAVVTPYSVSDMWGQLPEYTKRAQQLGTTIADMYNATTLYYQQGLDTEHAMGTAVETLKMARIAGIEGAEATDLMTAALRGFRMESNEANASHVNDVYSALAASSASDTYEIGTAMSKVASLASSANMDLETTATFLAQIIETTREAPETAGTALKTIIARFGEVKKLSQEGLFTGTDEEGEVIDINKVDTALKTAGISLQDFINGNEGLDQVFLRLAERWDSLSIVQQRYIATQAAGARMQARFIAMMQDYGRTQELLGVASNAEGAGEKQFAKTTESLEFKLNQLKDSYHSFIMGIANSSAIKKVVDLLATGFDKANSAIQKISGAIDHFNSGLGSVAKTALSLGTAFAALKIGGKALNTGVDLLGGLILGKGAVSAGRATGGGGILGGVNNARAAAFTKPIIAKLDTLIATIKIGNKNTAGLAAYKDGQSTGISAKGLGFLGARSDVNSALKQGTSVNDLQKNILNKYDEGTQRAILNTSPGTAQAIRQSYLKAAKNLNLDAEGTAAARVFVRSQEKAFKTGRISFDTYAKTAAMATTKSFAKPMQTAGEQVSQLMAYGMSEDQAYQQIIQSNMAEAEQQVRKQWRENLSGNMATAPKEMQDKYIDKQISQHPELFQKEVNEKAFGKDGKVQTKGVQNVANAFSSVGAGIASAGMSLNMFSMQLNSMGADKAAAAVSGLGSAFTTVGMAASSVGSIVAAAGTKAGIAGLVIGGVAATALAAYKAYQKHIQGIRDEGKQVTKDYKKNVIEQRKSLKDLTNGYEEYEKLRQGVDSKGNNLTLSDEQYQQYQDYTDKLISMNSALQQGVNESGKAYISQSADIQKALKQEAEEADRAEQKYLTNGSAQKIANQIGTYKRLQGLFNEGEADATYEAAKRRTRGASVGGGQKTVSSNAGKFTADALKIKDAIDQMNLSVEDLNEMGLKDIDWGNIDSIDAKKIYDASSALSSYIANSDKLNESQEKTASEAVSGITKTYNDAIEASSDMTDWLEAYLTSTNMDGASIEKAISDKFNLSRFSDTTNSHLSKIGQSQAASLTEGFREGLEQLSLQYVQEGWSIDELKQKATDYANSLKQISSSAEDSGGKYSKALTDIAKAQTKYDEAAASGDQGKAASNYNKNIKKAITELNTLAGIYEDKAAETGDLGAARIAESIREGMLQAVAYTTNGAERIQENLNVLAGSFESANSAVENYQEQTKDLKDFYTAAEGMKSILDDIGWDEEKKQLIGKDVEGHGSQKFWLAAENLVDEKVLDQGFDTVKSKITQLAPTLEEGQKGFESFLDYLDNNYDKVSKWYKKDNEGNVWFENLDDSNIKKMADQLGVSDEYLSSMINKSRQFMGSWNLSNIEGLLSGITSAEGTIAGKTIGKKGKKENAYFYNYDTLRSEALAAGVTDFGKDSEFQKIVQELQNNGVKLLNIDQLTDGTAKERKAQAKIATDLVNSNVEGWKEGSELSGKKLENAVKPLVESGQYSADDALAILQAAGAVGTEDEDVEGFSQAWDKASASPELSATNQIADNTAQTNNLLAQILAQNGTTPKEVADNIDASHEEVVGKKGISDTWYQRFGRHQENEDGETLTYNEKKAGLTKIDAKVREAEADLAVATQAWKSAKAKYGENSDKAKEEEAHVKTAQSTIDELNYAKTHGGAGVVAAEALLGGNASKFKYGTIKTEKDLEGLNKFDTDITNFLNGGGKLNTDRVQELLASSGMNENAQYSILGQYARQRMYDKGFDAIKGKGITNQDIGEALNASSIGDFVEAINNSSLKKLNKKQFEENLNLLAEQYANIHDVDKDKVKKAVKEGDTSISEPKNTKESTSAATTGISELSQSEYESRIDFLAKQAINTNNLVDDYNLKNYNSDAFTDKNRLNKDNFSALAQELKGQNAPMETQSKIMGQYLQNNANQLVTQKASNDQIAASIQQAAEVMSQNKMEPEAIAAAINQGYGTTLTKNDITTNKNGEVEVNLKKDGLKEQLEGLTADVEARITKISAAATGQNNHRFGTFARGSRHGYTIPGRPTLTGEEGEELVWEPRRNQAYMVGTNGPQFANISKDAVVWNAAQTKRIKKNSGSAYFGTGARGIRNFGTMGGGTKIEGKFDLDAMANITDVKDPSKKPEIPVTARIEGTKSGGLKNQIMSLFGKDTTTEIPVTANIGEVNPPEQEVPVDAYAKVTKVTKAGTISGEPVSVKATVGTVTTDDKTKGPSVAAKVTGTDKVTALTGAINKVPSSIKPEVTAQVSGTAQVLALSLAIASVHGKDVDVTVHKKVQDDTGGKAGGLGKYTPHNWNSFAVGRKRSDPSFKGGLALTGEEGYEIAWSPKEGRSMILGADGPEMVELPKDIVIWTHEESKKIAKGNRGIPIGSFSDGASSGKYKRTTSTSSGGSTGTKGTIPKTTKESDDKKTSAAVAQATGGIYKIDVQIYNLTKKIEQTTNKIEKNSEDIKDKLSNSIDFSYDQISRLVKNQSSLLRTQVSDNKKLTNKYNKKLLDLNAGKGRYKKYQISYEKKVKKDGKTSKETKTRNVNLGKFIKKSGDAYVLDYKALRKVAKNKKLGKNYAKAIMEAAQKEIDDLSSKKLSASKATDDARKKLQELRKELQETLFGWENELTKIKTLQDKITLGESFSKVMEGIQDLITQMINPSLNDLADLSTKYQRSVKVNIEAQKTQLGLQRDLLEAHKAQLSSDLSLADEYANLSKAREDRKGAKAGSAEWEFYNTLYNQRQKELEAAQVGARLTSVSVTKTGQIVVDFDWEQFNKERYDTAEGVNNLEYDKVKEYYEKIVDSVQNINDDYVEITNTIASLYDQRKDQYQMMSDYTQKIREGMEEEEQKTIDNLNDLNKSIQDAFKDLIDNVKKELDRQRKAEKNQKDEEDISNKANRLAMLRADTSGSNAAKIAQLEKELTEATGNYEDSLEDQLLDRLQDQADEAAKQREKQIELLTAQLNYSKSAGLYLAKAENLVQKIANGDTTPQTQQLARLYYLGSDELLDKWGKVIAAQEFAGDTLKVSNFNETIAQYDIAIKETEDAAEKLLAAALNLNNAASQFAKGNLEQVKAQVLQKTLTAAEAKDKLINEGGMNRSEALKYLKDTVGYKAKDFHDSGLSIENAKTAGFNAVQAVNGGYTAKDLKKGKYTVKQALNAAAKSKQLSRKQVVGAYGSKAVGKADAGKSRKTSIDTAKKKNVRGTVSSTGKTVAVGKSNKLQYQSYDTVGAKGTGKIKTIKFADFTAALVKKNQAEAGKTLLNQLKTSKVGSVIHKKWTSLAKASTTLKSGKAVRNTASKISGTIDGSGNFYYNTSQGIKSWNPQSGKITFEKKWKKDAATAKEFLAKAKKNKGIAREYYQLLDAKGIIEFNKKGTALFTEKAYKLGLIKKNKVGDSTGIKKYKTGGKADFTGPAWLDGTPSKPELVLNSTDTKNFLTLKDVLSEATKRGVFDHDNSDSGDINLDIDINVDKIDSDYDVDQIANKVKKIIIKEARTRNVTVTGRAR